MDVTDEQFQTFYAGLNLVRCGVMRPSNGKNY